MATTLDTILSYLQDKLGLSSAQAAGVAGNWQVESGFDPTAHNDREGAIGLAQWEGPRRTALQKFAASAGTSETDLMTQLAFFGQELHGSESSAYSKLLATNNAAAAAAVFDQTYERSSGASRGLRISNAEKIAAGRPTTTGKPTTTGAAGTASGPPLVDGMGSIGGTAFTVGMKILGGGVAAALVIVGAVNTVK
jgi:hypothetical protein